MQLKKIHYRIISIFFLLLGLTVFLFRLNEGAPGAIFWLCPASVFLFAIGLYFMNNFLISSALTSSFALNFVWTADFISFLLTGNPAIGVVQYLPYATPLEIAITTYHLFILIFPAFVIFKMKKMHKYSWFGASIFLLLLSIVSLIITNPTGNINCAHKTCFLGIFDFLNPINDIIVKFIPPLVIHWLFITIIVFIPTHFFFRKIVAWVSKRSSWAYEESNPD